MCICCYAKQRNSQQERSGLAVANRSRKVFEFIDYNFIFIFQGNLAPNEFIKGDTHRLARRGRNSRTEDVLVDQSAAITRTTHRRKRHLPRLPPELVGECTRRHPKANEVGGNVIRLHDIMNIGVIDEAPTRKLNVEFAAVSFGSNAIPGNERQNCRWFEMSDVLYLEPVCSVTEGAIKLYFRRAPFVGTALRSGDGEHRSCRPRHWRD